MPTTALYYPWMHFQRDDWLKLALLTWDGMVRVRPRTVEDQDNDLVRQLRAETDFLTEIQPSNSTLKRMDATFGRIIEECGDELAQRYRVAVPGGRPSYRRPFEPLEPRADDEPPLFWIYGGKGGPKFTTRLARALLDAGLAVNQFEYLGDRWLGLHPTLASIYMACLADDIAHHNQLSPATDDPRMHHAVGAIDHLVDLLFEREPVAPIQDPETAYLHVALRAVIQPNALSTVSATKLIKFRDRHTAELVAFRAHVASFAPQLWEIMAVESPDIALAHVENIYRRETRPQLANLRRALRGLGVESTAGALALKVDLGAATIAGGQLAVAGTAAALAVLPYVATTIAARRQKIEGSPVAYLLAADRDLNDGALLRRLTGR